jgi:hypothetical protein
MRTLTAAQSADSVFCFQNKDEQTIARPGRSSTLQAFGFGQRRNRSGESMHPKLQELLGTIASKFRRTETGEKDDSQEIEQLAEQIIEYGRMIHYECPQQRVFINVTEVARRFREDRQRVIKALVLLQRQGRAEHTARREVWKLNIQPTEQRESA